ncbi:unnamed protein product, partial [Boreogadus saida]
GGSRRSSWNSLGRAPSLKRQKRQSGERRSLLSGEGGSSSDEGEGHAGGVRSMEEEDDNNNDNNQDNVSLARTDSMSGSQSQSQGSQSQGSHSQSQGSQSHSQGSHSQGSQSQGPRHRRMESVETRCSMELPAEMLLQVPYLCRSASMHSSRPPSLGSQWPPEHSDCNGKGTPAAGPGSSQISLDGNAEEETAEEEATAGRVSRMFGWLERKQPEWCRQRASWAIYIFPPENRFRIVCNRIIGHKMFDHIVLAIIFLNCITIAMERPRIEPASAERIILTLSNYIFTAIFVTEMTVKIVALGWCFGDKAYLRSSWNLLDGMLVMISVIDILVSLISNSGTKILGMLRVLRLLRTLRPLRVISRAPGLKLVVETLMSSLKPIGNIVVICCAFFIIFGILGVQFSYPGMLRFQCSVKFTGVNVTASAYRVPASSVLLYQTAETAARLPRALADSRVPPASFSPCSATFLVRDASLLLLFPAPLSSHTPRLPVPPSTASTFHTSSLPFLA